MKRFWNLAMSCEDRSLSSSLHRKNYQPTRRSRGLVGTAIGLMSCLSLATGCWLTQATIAPQVVQAYTSRVSVDLDYQKGETYEVLVQRANVAARAAIQRSFDRDILVSEVLAIVTAQRNGLVVPVMSVEVTRAQWRRSPDSRTWANYFATTKTLLQLDQPTVTAPPQSAPPSAAPETPTEQPSPTGNPPSPNTPPPAANIPLPGLPNGPVPTTIPGSPSLEVTPN